MEASKDSELKKLYADQIAKDRQLVRAWQKIANGIVSKSNKENNLTKDDLDYLIVYKSILTNEIKRKIIIV